MTTQPRTAAGRALLENVYIDVGSPAMRKTYNDSILAIEGEAIDDYEGAVWTDEQYVEYGAHQYRRGRAQAEAEAAASALDVAASCTFGQYPDPLCGRAWGDRSIHSPDDEPKRPGTHLWRHEPKKAHRLSRPTALDPGRLAEAMYQHQPADLRDAPVGSLHCGRECAPVIAAEYARLASADEEDGT